MNLRYLSYVLPLLLMLSCGTGKDNTPSDDSISAKDTLLKDEVDSMPVLKPHVHDSAVLITPPVNDSNVVVPDSNSRSK